VEVKVDLSISLPLITAMNLPWVEWPTTVIKYARNTLWTDG